jgi:hypothetical protein
MSNNRTNRLPASAADNLALAEHAAAIRKLSKQTIENVIEIGRHLVEAKAKVKKLGESWGGWLDREFGWKERSAQNFMQVYEASKSAKFADLSLPVSTIYLLTARSTPKEARDEIIARAQAGETVPVAEVKRTIERTRGRVQPSHRTTDAPTKPESSASTTAQFEVGAELKHLIATWTGTTVGQRVPADDIGADSRAETERLRVRVEELQAQVRQRDIKITGLESEIEELRAKLATGTGGDMSVSEFQTAIKKWEETVATQRGIIARLENENAKLRAGVAAPPDDGLDIPECLRRATP